MKATISYYRDIGQPFKYMILVTKIFKAFSDERFKLTRRDLSIALANNVEACRHIEELGVKTAQGELGRQFVAIEPESLTKVFIALLLEVLVRQVDGCGGGNVPDCQRGGRFHELCWEWCFVARASLETEGSGGWCVMVGMIVLRLCFEEG
ncbi:hypothetical protein RRG08_050784 [Elysia crispata]|uniref:Uncharacterized protein n=1 Tax=Elysia crispata TaxID=231223 RepID=A0AAE1CZ13_9GAST|nr:hypothetical protein RRG08_050784 [Elysia crispata]